MGLAFQTLSFLIGIYELLVDVQYGSRLYQCSLSAGGEFEHKIVSYDVLVGFYIGLFLLSCCNFEILG